VRYIHRGLHVTHTHERECKSYSGYGGRIISRYYWVGKIKGNETGELQHGETRNSYKILADDIALGCDAVQTRNLQVIALKMEAASTPETSVNFY
jgi:hypothetical protein